MKQKRKRSKETHAEEQDPALRDRSKGSCVQRPRKDRADSPRTQPPARSRSILRSVLFVELFLNG
jgi:hypothetical protein